MPVVSGAEFLKAARKGGYAVGGFNTNNLEWTQAILEAAEAKQAPVLIQTSMGAAKYMGGYKICKDLITDLVEAMNITVPVAIHLDHGDYEAALECIELGYTSVMFDGSHLPFEENLKLAKDVVEKAHAKGISVECEVGSIGGEEDGIIGNGELADIEECKQMVATGIDYLACGIGNIHGQYPENWKGLAFDHLQAIADAVGPDMPLVFQLSFAAATRKYIEAGKDKEGKGFDPRKLLAPGKAAIVEDAKSHIDWFGSANKA